MPLRNDYTLFLTFFDKVDEKKNDQKFIYN